ncbi:major facilitator superfamily domain-containing protein [Exophiala viscosa]|uniref:Major facilitator superfamily domain-containing protein n=1 Tax=Exophiala viscosa TaxID=2486360 RepID=A0AAN6E2S5_9EURO|nr:major facilitator superfamily domain-containing protein [Exophiala viscosa]
MSSITLEPAGTAVAAIPTKSETLHTSLAEANDSDQEHHTENRAAYVAGRGRVKRRWYQWYADTDSPTERKLLVKMDILILTYAFLGFWAKYIDNGNLTNAYVSGMKEDLGFNGNQLVQLQTIYTVAYTVFMIPLTLMAAKYRFVIPACDLMWGIFTLLQYRVTSFGELAAYRFMVGAFESVYFTSIHYVLGSWYRSDELGRRAGIFYLSTGVGLMSTGFMASGVVLHLDGVHGLAGWRWLFIVCSVATIPIAFIGFIFFPSTPDKTKTWFLTKEEKELARLRMARIGGKPPTGFSGWNTIRRFFGRWHFWALVLFQLPWGWSNAASSNGAYTLWIKSLKQYDTSEVNLLSTVNPGVGIFFVWFYSFLSDALQTRMPIIVGQCLFQFVMQFAFVIWKSPTAYKWAALSTGYGQVAVSPLVYSWANEICREDAEERAFVIGSMLAISNAFSAWIPLLVWATKEAPRYAKGYIFAQVNIVLFALTTVALWWWDRRDQRRALAKGI